MQSRRAAAVAATGVVWAAALITALLAGIGVDRSAAAVVAPVAAASTDVFTDVGIRETSAPYAGPLTVDVDWQVPAGTLGGDSATLVIPPGLLALPAGFDLRTSTGVLVA